MGHTWKCSSKKRRRSTVAPAVKGADGRVHLVLQQRGSSKVVGGLSAPLFAEQWQDTLALTTANAALRHLGDLPTPAGVEALTTEAMNALSKLADGLASQSERKIACGAGCAHCCHQSVGVTGAEALTIVGYVNSHWPTTRLAELRAKVSTMREQTRGSSYRERYSPTLPCVFLGDGGRCTIYDVRPLVCRAVNSLDADECRDNLHDATKRAAFLDNGQGASALLAPFRASHAISAGLQLAGSDVYGLDMRPLDLVAVMDVLLNQPDAARRWFAGETVLASASGSDATSNPQLRTLAGLKPDVG